MPELIYNHCSLLFQLNTGRSLRSKFIMSFWSAAFKRRLTRGRHATMKRMLEIHHPALDNRRDAIKAEHDISRRLYIYIYIYIYIYRKDGRRGGGGPKELRTIQIRERGLFDKDNFTLTTWPPPKVGRGASAPDTFAKHTQN